MATWTGVLPAVTIRFLPDDRHGIAEMERCFKFQRDAGVPGQQARRGPTDGRGDCDRWFRPLLDVSARLVQNIKLVEALAIDSNDRCRASRSRERARIEAIVKAAEAARAALPSFRNLPSF